MQLAWAKVAVSVGWAEGEAEDGVRDGRQMRRGGFEGQVDETRREDELGDAQPVGQAEVAQASEGIE